MFESDSCVEGLWSGRVQPVSNAFGLCGVVRSHIHCTAFYAIDQGFTIRTCGVSVKVVMGCREVFREAYRSYKAAFKTGLARELVRPRNARCVDIRSGTARRRPEGVLKYASVHMRVISFSCSPEGRREVVRCSVA